MGGTSFDSGAPARTCYVISPNGICSRGSSAVDMSMTSSELLRNRQFKRQHFALVANELTKMSWLRLDAVRVDGIDSSLRRVSRPLRPAHSA